MRRFNLFISALFLILTWSVALSHADGGSILPEDILKMSVEEMLNIKITTAGKKEEKIADIPASTVIITREDIEKYGFMNLEEIIENIPGMYAIDDYAAYRKTYGVRGFYAGYPRNIIFMVNGVTQADGVFDYYVMSNFNIPVEAIDRIEVVRGPMSVLYGQGAFFGAINIITNDSEDDTSLVSFSAGDGIEKAATKVSGSQDDFHFSMSAGYSNDDGPDNDINKLVSNISSLRAWGIDESNDTTGGRLERSSKNFVFSGKYKKFYTDFSFNKSTDEVFVYRPSVTDGSPYDRETAIVSFGYKDRVTDNITLNGRMAYHSFSFTLDWDITSSSFNGRDAGETKGESDFYEYELDAFIDISDTVDLTTGIYYKETQDTMFQAEVPIFNIFNRTETGNDMNLWALFAQINYTPTSRLRFVSGLRVEQQNDYSIIDENATSGNPLSVNEGNCCEDDVDLIPSFAAIYSFNERNIFKLLYGKAIARPSFFQNRDQIEEDFPPLQAEEIQTFEANYISILSQDLTTNFSLFHNILDNLIVRTVSTEEDLITDYFTNGGKLITNGAELSLRFQPFEKFQTELSVTYQSTEDQRTGFEDIDVAYSPNLLGYMKMSYNLTDDVVMALTGTYVDDMETEWDVRLNDHQGGRVGQAVDSHFILGANIRINNIFAKDYFMNIRGSNILDSEYYYPTYVNNTWADRGTLGNPMELLITIGKKF